MREESLPAPPFVSEPHLLQLTVESVNGCGNGCGQQGVVSETEKILFTIIYTKYCVCVCVH